MVERRTPERQVGFDPHSGRRVVSLSRIHLPPKKYWKDSTIFDSNIATKVCHFANKLKFIFILLHCMGMLFSLIKLFHRWKNVLSGRIFIVIL